MIDDAVAVYVPPTSDEGYIKCPNCRRGMLKDVKDSRPTTVFDIQSVRRRRVCSSCGQRATTYEIPDAVFGKLFKQQTAKQKLAARIVELIDNEVRTELTRLITGSTDGATYTPREEDIT